MAFKLSQLKKSVVNANPSFLKQSEPTQKMMDDKASVSTVAFAPLSSQSSFMTNQDMLDQPRIQVDIGKKEKPECELPPSEDGETKSLGLAFIDGKVKALQIHLLSAVLTVLVQITCYKPNCQHETLHGFDLSFVHADAGLTITCDKVWQTLRAVKGLLDGAVKLTSISIDKANDTIARLQWEQGLKNYLILGDETLISASDLVPQSLVERVLTGTEKKFYWLKSNFSIPSSLELENFGFPRYSAITILTDMESLVGAGKNRFSHRLEFSNPKASIPERQDSESDHMNWADEVADEILVPIVSVPEPVAPVPDVVDTPIVTVSPSVPALVRQVREMTNASRPRDYNVKNTVVPKIATSTGSFVLRMSPTQRKEFGVRRPEFGIDPLAAQLIWNNTYAGMQYWTPQFSNPIMRFGYELKNAQYNNVTITPQIATVAGEAIYQYLADNPTSVWVPLFFEGEVSKRWSFEIVDGTLAFVNTTFRCDEVDGGTPSTYQVDDKSIKGTKKIEKKNEKKEVKQKVKIQKLPIRAEIERLVDEKQVGIAIVGDDLFKNVTPDDMIIHNVGADLALGAGFALGLKKRFSLDVTKFVGRAVPGRNDVSLFLSKEEKTPLISHVVTKKRSSGKPTLESFSQGLEDLMTLCAPELQQAKRICMPAIGCGLDGLNPNLAYTSPAFQTFSKQYGYKTTMYLL